jgi:hypothetical protein
MKNIETYRIFESNHLMKKRNDDYIIDTIKDLLLDLEDDGLTVRVINTDQINGIDFYNKSSRLLIFIENKNGSIFNINNYKSQLESVREFLKIEKYHIHSFIWKSNYKSDHHSHLEFTHLANNDLFNEIFNITFKTNTNRHGYLSGTNHLEIYFK